MFDNERLAQAVGLVESLGSDEQATQQETAPKQETQQDVKQTTSSEVKNENGADEGHSVPYSRFKSVNESKKELSKKVADYERELNELREKAKSWETSRQTEEKKVQTRKEPETFEDLFKDDDNTEDDRYQSFDSRLRTFEQKQATVELEREISDVEKRFPRVPKEVLLQAVIQNPSIQLQQVALAYDSWAAEIEQKAIDEYLKTTKTNMAPQAPRRPSSQVTGGSTSVVPQGKMNNQQRANAAGEFLKKSGFFG